MTIYFTKWARSWDCEFTQKNKEEFEQYASGDDAIGTCAPIAKITTVMMTCPTSSVSKALKAAEML